MPNNTNKAAPQAGNPFVDENLFIKIILSFSCPSMQEKNLSSQNIWIFEDFFDTESWHQGKQREHCRKLSGELHF